MHLLILRIYTLAYLLCAKAGLKLRGLGFIARSCTRLATFRFKGTDILFDPSIGDNYLYMLINRYNEPETHAVIHEIVRSSHRPVVFCDVGANVGVYVVDMLNNPNVSRVIAFEPQVAQYKVLDHIRSRAASGRLLTENVAVSDTSGYVELVAPERYTLSTSTRPAPPMSAHAVPCTTLDEYFSTKPDHVDIILADVEGGELKVVRGARQLISKCRPWIVFEYNEVTRRSFTLDEMRAELGSEYEVFRINQSGRLDQQVENTWNMLAAPRSGVCCVAALLPTSLLPRTSKSTSV